MCGYEAELVEDSDKVVALATKLQPAAILLDTAMPDSNGLELLEDLRKSNPESPVIIMTGHEDPALVPQMFHGGARDCLMKPIDCGRLRHALEGALGEEQNRIDPEVIDGPKREANVAFASAAEYVHAFVNSGHGDLAFVPISLAAEYLGITPTGATQLARRGEMREIVIGGPTKKWIGIEVWSLIRHREKAKSIVPDLADRVQDALEKIAANEEVCGLLDIMGQLGMNSRVPQNRHVVHEALALVSARTYRQQGFLLSAICALTSLGKPSDTFFALAERIGALKVNMDRGRFFKSQVKKAFNHYRRGPGETDAPPRPTGG